MVLVIYFFQSLSFFSLCFGLDSFYCYVFRFTDLVFCSVMIALILSDEVFIVEKFFNLLKCYLAFSHVSVLSSYVYIFFKFLIIFIIVVLISLFHNSTISVLFFLVMGHVFLLLCLSSNFLLNIEDYEIYIVLLDLTIF